MLIKFVLGVLSTLFVGFATFIAAGVIEAKSLESRVKSLEGRGITLDKDMSDFKSIIKEDIGHIKGQNDTIIKLLQGRKHDSGSKGN